MLDELPEKWRAIHEAVLSVEREKSLGVARLDHPAAKVVNFKKKTTGENESKIVTRVFEDTKAMTNNLRLKPSMLNHHMPWGYNGVFENHGKDLSQVPIETFNQVLAI